jgi:glycosyltransferase involved in cell wall biosynthesis
VTFVAWQGLAAALPDYGSPIGGLETGAWTYCRGLARNSDWQPRFVARSGANLPKRNVDGVEVVPLSDRWLGIRRDVAAHLTPLWPPRLRQFSARLLWEVPLLAVTWPFRPRDPEPMRPDPRLLRLAEPDAWVAMGVGREASGVVATAAAQSRPSLIMIQSNFDLDERYRTDPDFVSEYGERAEHCRFALENATLVVCQTDIQRQQLHRVFGREGCLIRNPCELQRWESKHDTHRRGLTHRRGPVLWIGRYDDFHKRIDRALEIARRCPETRFRFIANPLDREVERRAWESCPPNVQLIERVPFDRMPREFHAAAAFLVTGAARAEGFPNVLLQAAAAGTPIVSLEDFDQFLLRSGSGWATGDNAGLAAETLGEVLRGERPIDQAKVRRYLKVHHSLDMISRQLDIALNSLTGRES